MASASRGIVSSCPCPFSARVQLSYLPPSHCRRAISNASANFPPDFLLFSAKVKIRAFFFRISQGLCAYSSNPLQSSVTRHLFYPATDNWIAAVISFDFALSHLPPLATRHRPIFCAKSTDPLITYALCFDLSWHPNDLAHQSPQQISDNVTTIYWMCKRGCNCLC